MIIFAMKMKKDREFLSQIVKYLPQDTADPDSWNQWLGLITKFERKGKAFMPIRLAPQV